MTGLHERLRQSKEIFEGMAAQNRVLQDRVDVLMKFVEGTQVCQDFESLDEASFQLEIDELILEKEKMRNHMQKEASRSHGGSLLAPAGPSVTDKSRTAMECRRWQKKKTRATFSIKNRRVKLSVLIRASIILYTHTCVRARA